MGYLVKQIPQVVKDAVTDVLGKTKAKKLNSSDIVTMGKALEDYDLLDGWFGALTNRIVETRYMIRSYTPNTRKILRNEHEFGAFVQRVYYTSAPDPTDNPVWATPTGGTYSQVSPYDVEGSIAVQSLIYGGSGTWTLELIRPVSQIKSAFTSPAEMDAFIAGIYTYIDNKFKLQEESIVNLAANTGIANALKSGLGRNFLNEFNMTRDTDILTVDEALRNADFLKYASKELSRIIENMGMMTTVFNKMEYETYTPTDMLVVEMLTEFAKASDVYLQADTFHNELVKLPNFERVPFWQSPGSKDFAFADCSKINVQNSEFAENVGDSDTVEQGGIIAFLHDYEYVAATFNERRTWELVNPRQDVVVHGEQARKGFAVDNYMNAFVVYVENAGNITVTGDANATLTYTHSYSGVQNEIKLSSAKTPSATGVTFTPVQGKTNTFSFVMPSNGNIAITVA